MLPIRHPISSWPTYFLHLEMFTVRLRDVLFCLWHFIVFICVLRGVCASVLLLLPHRILSDVCGKRFTILWPHARQCADYSEPPCPASPYCWFLVSSLWSCSPRGCFGLLFCFVVHGGFFCFLIFDLFWRVLC